MINAKLILSFALILVITLLPSILAESVPWQQSTFNQDKTVNVSIFILNLGKFDVASGSFTADFYLDLKCESVCPPIDFEFSNGRANSLDKIIDNPSEKFYRIQAQLASPVDLRRFPFDRQNMQIILEDKSSTIDKLRFVPDIESSGIDRSIAFTGWIIGSWNASVQEHFYPVYDETYSQFVFTIPISKAPFNSTLKTLLPVMFIILVMLSSFLLDLDKITTRLSMVGSALVAAVMFHVSITNQLPSVSYLTFADKFMIMTYFIILLSFILNVTIMELHSRNLSHKAQRLHLLTEYSIIFITIILYVLLFLLFI